jgi:hypothetical protein
MQKSKRLEVIVFELSSSRSRKRHSTISHRNCWIVLYSLTKYSAIFAEVKGYFRITAPDNQHGQRSSCSLRSKNWYQLDNQLEVVVKKRLF